MTDVAQGLKQLTVEQLRQGMQVNDKTNPLVGLEGRCALLNRLGEAVEKQSTYFPPTSAGVCRPGCLLDFLLQHARQEKEGKTVVRMETMWEAVIQGFQEVWPATRTQIQGVSMGDVWPCDVLSSDGSLGVSHLVPFHKLSQWLTYSLMEPLEKWMNMKFEDLHLMTGLPEYRNGGLFVDFGVLKLKAKEVERGLVFAQSKGADPNVPLFEPSDPVIIEWRAMTVALLDLVGSQVRERFGMTAEELPLVKVLEGGTWKAGREIAAKKRPQTRGPPIQIYSDGTVF